MLDCPTKERMSRRSSPSGTEACCGKRLYATQPAMVIAVVATTCAATIAAMVGVQTVWRGTAIAVKRNAIETKRKNARTS